MRQCFHIWSQLPPRCDQVRYFGFKKCRKKYFLTPSVTSSYLTWESIIAYIEAFLRLQYLIASQVRHSATRSSDQPYLLQRTVGILGFSPRQSFTAREHHYVSPADTCAREVAFFWDGDSSKPFQIPLMLLLESALEQN